MNTPPTHQLEPARPVVDKDSYMYRTYGRIIDAIIAKNPDFDLEAFERQYGAQFKNYDTGRHEIFRRSNEIPIVKDTKNRDTLSRPANEAENGTVNSDPEHKRLLTALVDFLDRHLTATHDDANLMKYAFEYSAEIGLHRFYGDKMRVRTLFEQFILPELQKRGHQLPSLQQIDSTDVFGPMQTDVAAEVAAALTEPEIAARVREMFRDPSRAFFVVEDDPRVVEKVVIDLKARRGTSGQENDPGVIPVGSKVGASKAIDSFLKEGGPSKIVVILDMEFPFKDDGRSPLMPGAGRVVFEEITQKVTAWNEAHQDNPVTLEVIMNSTSIRIMEQAKKLGAVSFSQNKNEAVEAVADYFKSSV